MIFEIIFLGLKYIKQIIYIGVMAVAVYSGDVDGLWVGQNRDRHRVALKLIWHAYKNWKDLLPLELFIEQ